MSMAEGNLKATQLQEILSELAQAANAESQFSQRNSKLNAERFVQTRVLVSALRRTGAHRRIVLDGLSQFSAIYVTDSTQVALPQALQVEFAGNCDNAMAKLHVTLDYLPGSDDERMKIIEQGWQKIHRLGAKTIYPGHGSVINLGK